MAYFPIFTDITNKKCLIIGGGKVALRKVETLLRYGGAVYVAAEEICPEIERILPGSHIYKGQMTEKIMEEKIKQDVKESVLVIAATNSRELNHQVAVFCRQYSIPVNVVDEPKECSFIFPAVVLKGDISVGINTGAKSPIVSKKIRENIEEAIPDYYVQIADQLGELRSYVKTHFKEETERRRILKNVASEAFFLERQLTEEEISAIIFAVSQG